MIEWVFNRLDTGDLPTRLDRLVRSLSDGFTLKNQTLTGVATGDLIPHGGRAISATVQVLGSNPAITATVGEITPTTVRVYSTAACTADIHVRIR